MAAQKRAKKKLKSRPLYHSAKISEYRFRKVIWYFVLDHTSSQTAQETRLSINSIEEIFRKFRIYFFEAGVFQDYFKGQNPVEFVSENGAAYVQLLDYHIARTARKRGLKQPLTEPPYHFCESYWRFGYQKLIEERPTSRVHDMMFKHLIEVIKTCGPIGTKPKRRDYALLLILDHLGELARWLARNAPGFKSAELRQGLQAIIEKTK